MDESRIIDMERLERVIANPKKHRSVRAQAEETKNKILVQSKDKKLRHLREMLIRANRAHDENEARHIERLIKIHEKAEYEDYI